MKTRMFLFAALVAALLVGGFSHEAFAKGGGTKTRITLAASSAYPNAKGKATYKVDGSEREFQVEAENIKKLAGKTVSVFVNGTKVGSAKVNSLGEANMELNTDLGHTVPGIKAGDKVQVKSPSGQLIVSGTF
jgi:hypothetical protein